MDEAIQRVGVVGLGTMGAGIAEVVARSAISVVAVDVDQAAVDRGRAALESSTQRALGRGRLSQDECDRLRGRVQYSADLTDLSGVDLVVEVVPERLEVKAEIFGRLDEILADTAILATNTSSLSVTRIAAATAHPQRVVGMHFFNPAPVQRLVEVVRTVLTDDAVVTRVGELATRLGKTPVVVGDRAGFVANALLFGYLNHAARMVDTGQASATDIDTAMREGAGLPMGPLALLDLIGLDTAEHIQQVMYAQSGDRLHLPTPTSANLVAAGMFGRKSGSGYYPYGQTHEPEPVDASTGAAPDGADLEERPNVAILGAGTAAQVLATLLASVSARVVQVGADADGAPAEPADLVGADLVLAAADGSHRDQDGSAAHQPVRVHVPTCAPWRTDATSRVVEVVRGPGHERAVRVLAGLGLTPVVCGDGAGYVVDALTATVVNDAARMQDSGYATAQDIDAAMTLGCAYPVGPAALLDALGAQRVLDVQRALHHESGEPGQCPALLLTRRSHQSGGTGRPGRAD